MASSPFNSTDHENPSVRQSGVPGAEEGKRLQFPSGGTSHGIVQDGFETGVARLVPHQEFPGWKMN